eukprot:2197212-Rhodomonas_salina.1
MHIPKSRMHNRPSEVRRKLPGCGSQCSKPVSSSIVKYAFNATPASRPTSPVQHTSSSDHFATQHSVSQHHLPPPLAQRQQLLDHQPRHSSLLTCLGRGQTLAVDPLGDKDSVGAELVNHFRGRHRIQTPRLHGLKEALRVHSLPLIVQLVHEPRAPLVCNTGIAQRGLWTDEADKVGVELHEALVRRRDDAAEVEVQRDVQHHAARKRIARQS